MGKRGATIGISVALNRNSVARLSWIRTRTTHTADGYYAAGQFQKAIEQYRKTLELDPNFDVASFGLGHAYAQLGMWREAVEAWQKGQASAGNASTAERMAWAYTQGGYESALQVWLADVPAEAHAHYVPATNVAAGVCPAPRQRAN